MKKGQISIFIIVSVIVIAGTFAFFTVNSKKGFEKNVFASDKPIVDNIKDSVLECMENSAKDSLVLAGVQGGYYNKPEKSFDTGYYFIPYYYDSGSLFRISKEKVENELADSANKELVSCLDALDFGNFNLEYSKPKTEVIISKENVLFNIDSILSIKRGDKAMKVELKQYPVSVDSPLNEILETANYIIDSIVENDERICITCIGYFARERNLLVEMNDLSERDSLVVISGEGYFFEFLNKYTEREAQVIAVPSVPGVPKIL